jgi:hypothetical protein
MTRGLIALVLLGACGATPVSRVGDASTSNGSDAKAGSNRLLDIPDGGGTVIGADALDPTFGSNCGTLTKSVSRIPVDLLLVLDRSGSMTWDMGQDVPCEQLATCHPRWPTMRDALAKVLTQSPDTIQWGLKLYSTPNAAASGGVPDGCVVTPGADAPLGTLATSLLATLDRTEPNYNTPTRAAVTYAVDYLKTAKNGHTQYILLATDGQPNCAVGGEYATSPDLPATLDAVAAAHAAGIKVYVIGVGPSAGKLDEMAQQGGTGRSYPALSPQELNDALGAIAGQVATCEFALSETPPNPARVGVYLDKKLVVRDDPNGWSLMDRTRVVFSGAACTQIKSGTYQKVDVLFGCAENPLFIP